MPNTKLTFDDGVEAMRLKTLSDIEALQDMARNSGYSARQALADLARGLAQPDFFSSAMWTETR